MLSVKTASGIKFTVTPNHPILTDRGWISVASLNKGDNIIIGGLKKNLCFGANPNKTEVPTKFNAFHEFLKTTGKIDRISRPNAKFNDEFSVINGAVE